MSRKKELPRRPTIKIRKAISSKTHQLEEITTTIITGDYHPLDRDPTDTGGVEFTLTENPMRSLFGV